MAQRMSSSQLRSKMRQLQSQQRQRIQKINSAINKYNQAVRAYNAQVRQNQIKMRSALARLRQAPVTHRYTVVRTSAVSLHESYLRLEQANRYEEDDPRFRLSVALPQQESVNSLAVAEALLGEEADGGDADEELQDSAISDELRRISPDLDNRWRGALFSLSPRNPDAARHFCSSTREIFTQILHMCAPDEAVRAALPGHQTDQSGRPTRRSRIRFLLHRKGMTDDALEAFVEDDITNVIELFELLNKGTHGEAGSFGRARLVAVKKRVEQALAFVTEVAGFSPAFASA